MQIENNNDNNKGVNVFQDTGIAIPSDTLWGMIRLEKLGGSTNRSLDGRIFDFSTLNAVLAANAGDTANNNNSAGFTAFVTVFGQRGEFAFGRTSAGNLLATADSDRTDAMVLKLYRMPWV